MFVKFTKTINYLGEVYSHQQIVNWKKCPKDQFDDENSYIELSIREWKPRVYVDLFENNEKHVTYKIQKVSKLILSEHCKGVTIINNHLNKIKWRLEIYLIEDIIHLILLFLH